MDEVEQRRCWAQIMSNTYEWPERQRAALDMLVHLASGGTLRSLYVAGFESAKRMYVISRCGQMLLGALEHLDAYERQPQCDGGCDVDREGHDASCPLSLGYYPEEE